MIGNKRHRARSAAVKLMVVGLALLMVAGIWLHNVLGLRESVLDFVEGVVAAAGVVDPDASTNIKTSSVIDCSDASDVIENNEDAIEFVSDVVNKVSNGDKKVELISNKETNSNGITFYRFDQTVDDIPVYGRCATVAVTGDGAAIGISSNCVPTCWSGEEGSFDVDRAVGVAKNALNGAETLNGKPVLYARDNGDIEKAWAIDLSNDDGTYEVVVSAVSGDVLCKTNLMDEAESTRSQAQAKNQEGLQLESDSGAYRYADEQRHIYILDGAKLKEKAGRWAEKRLSAYGESGKIYRKSEDLDYWVDENGDRVLTGTHEGAPCFGENKDKARYFLRDVQDLRIDKANENADTLQDVLTKTYDYYANHLGYSGANGVGGAVYGLVNAKVLNAQIQGWCQGNPISLISVSKSKNYYTLSTLAHEYTHGVVNEMSPASVGEESEKKSLGEAISDIMSYVIRDEADNGIFDNSIEWCMEGTSRRADRTGWYPSSYKKDGWWNDNTFFVLKDCHINSTVISHAAYLMCGDNGLTGSPITTEQLGTLTFMVTNMLSSTADFPEFARLFTMMAARLAKSSSMGMNASRAQRVKSAFVEVNLPVDSVKSDAALKGVASSDSGKAQNPQDASSPKPVDISLVLDASGSMDGDPEANVKKAANKMIDDIDVEGARFGVCAYSSDLVASCALSESKNNAAEAINSIDANGGTDIGLGLSGGHELLSDAGAGEKSEQRKIIVLMSDELPTTGENEEQIQARAEKYKSENIKLYTLGFNLDASGQNLMRSIASEGCYFNVANEDDLKGFFEDIAAEINGVRYTYIRVACPVDVSVARNGETLSSEETGTRRTSFGTVQIETEDTGDTTHANEVKVIRLRSDDEYQLRIEGTGSGDMTVECDFMDSAGDYSDRRSFTDVSVNPAMQAVVGINGDVNTRMEIDDDGDGFADRALEASANSEARTVDNSLFMKVIYLSMLGASIFLALSMIRRAVGKQEGNKNVLS